MICKICGLQDQKALADVEAALHAGKGRLSKSAKSKLAEKHKSLQGVIEELTEQDCQLHYLFHQGYTRTSDKGSIETEKTLASDVGRSEADILYDILNAQAATLKLMQKRINETLQDSCQLNVMIIHPETAAFYNSLAGNIRATVKELRELNTAVNGVKDNSLEGFKLFAQAIQGIREQSKDEPDMTTKEFDY